MANKPKKWTQVYPQGTKAGDEEQKFFIALARHPKYDFRSTSAIAKETGLSKDRVEEIVSKYINKGMVFQNPKNEEQWGYWERCPQMLASNTGSITKADQNKRIDGVCNSRIDSGSMGGGSGGKSTGTFHQKTASKKVTFADDGPQRSTGAVAASKDEKRWESDV